MMSAFIMGFACGLPLLLTLSVLQAWMKEEGVDLTVIGLMALVGLPYTLKFVWAPLLDRYTLPFLGRVPMDPQVVLGGDSGRPYLSSGAGTVATDAFDEILDNVIKDLPVNKNQT